MSRGFVKEGDQEDTPVVNPRVHLPHGVTNYVTPNGYEALKQEQNLLIEERKTLTEQSKENNRIQINYLTAKLLLLEERIHSAKIVNLGQQNQNEIQFGAIVTLYKEAENCNCHYQIVGVDEANIALHKISFLSPIAKVLLNKKIGDKITLKTPKGNRIMCIEAIEYPQ
jgi:transcription elongation GreA/GreB family factor